MLLTEFSARAEEFLRLAQQTNSQHDRDLFIELARACYGLEDKEKTSSVMRPH
jgi:hypothetical protein